RRPGGKAADVITRSADIRDLVPAGRTVGRLLDIEPVGEIGTDRIVGPGQIDLTAGRRLGHQVAWRRWGLSWRGDQTVHHQHVVRIAGAGADVHSAIGYARHLELDRGTEGVAGVRGLVAGVKLIDVTIGAVGAQLIG